MGGKVLNVLDGDLWTFNNEGGMRQFLTDERVGGRWKLSEVHP